MVSATTAGQGMASRAAGRLHTSSRSELGRGEAGVLPSSPSICLHRPSPVVAETTRSRYEGKKFPLDSATTGDGGDGGDGGMEMRAAHQLLLSPARGVSRLSERIRKADRIGSTCMPRWIRYGWIRYGPAMT